jgi:hypothetical protein
MEIQKIEILNKLEQNPNKNSVSNDDVVEMLKSIYSINKETNFVEKISELKKKINDLTEEVENKKKLFLNSIQIKKDFNKKIEEIDLEIQNKRISLLEKLGEEI